MFKPRFAALVAAGKKRQTVRPPPKRCPRRGDLLSLRKWSGKPHRSRQKVLLETKVQSVGVIYIDKEAICVTAPDGCLLAMAGAKVISLIGDDADRFARSDGFGNFSEMLKWFEDEHGLPFNGIVIYW